MVNYITEKEMNDNFDKILSFAKNHYRELSVKETKRDFDYEDGRLFYGKMAIRISLKCKYINLYFSIFNISKICLEPILTIWDKNTEYRFDLWDYLDPKKIDMFHTEPTILMYREKLLYDKHLHDYKDIDEFNIPFFCVLDKLITTEDMQRILNTDYKPEVHRDWSRCGYK